MIFLDESQREPVTIGPVTYQIGPVPVGKLEVLELAISEARRSVGEIGPDEAGKLLVAVLPAYRELVRWGLKGWSLPRPLELVREPFAGGSCEVVAPRLVEVLSRVNSGALVVSLAHEVLRCNRISEEELLGFG